MSNSSTPAPQAKEAAIQAANTLNESGDTPPSPFAAPLDRPLHAEGMCPGPETCKDPFHDWADTP